MAEFGAICMYMCKSGHTHYKLGKGPKVELVTFCVELKCSKENLKKKNKKNLYIFYSNRAGMENHVHIVLICGLLLRNFNR